MPTVEELEKRKGQQFNKIKGILDELKAKLHYAQKQLASSEDNEQMYPIRHMLETFFEKHQWKYFLNNLFEKELIAAQEKYDRIKVEHGKTIKRITNLKTEKKHLCKNLNSSDEDFKKISDLETLINKLEQDRDSLEKEKVNFAILRDNGEPLLKGIDLFTSEFNDSDPWESLTKHILNNNENDFAGLDADQSLDEDQKQKVKSSIEKDLLKPFETFDTLMRYRINDKYQRGYGGRCIERKAKLLYQCLYNHATDIKMHRELTHADQKACKIIFACLDLYESCMSLLQSMLTHLSMPRLEWNNLERETTSLFFSKEPLYNERNAELSDHLIIGIENLNHIASITDALKKLITTFTTLLGELVEEGEGKIDTPLTDKQSFAFQAFNTASEAISSHPSIAMFRVASERSLLKQTTKLQVSRSTGSTPTLLKHHSTASGKPNSAMAALPSFKAHQISQSDTGIKIEIEIELKLALVQIQNTFSKIDFLSNQLKQTYIAYSKTLEEIKKPAPSANHQHKKSGNLSPPSGQRRRRSRTFG